MKTDWYQSSLDRKEPLESDEWKRSASKEKRKRLKKFCRGHEGRVHSPIIKKHSWSPRPCYADNSRWFPCNHYLACGMCGKTLSFSLQGTQLSCPEASWGN
jgi:hypothetical protein